MNTPDTLQARVERSCMHALFAQIPMTAAVSMVVAAAVVVALWNAAPRATLAIWYGLVVANHLARMALGRAFRRADPEGPALRRWAHRFTLAMAIGAAIFGSAPVLFLPYAGHFQQAFLIIVIAGLVAGNITVSAYHPPAMLAHHVPMLLPLFAQLARAGTFELGLLALASLFYFGIVLVFGFRQARLIRESIAHSHRNEDLVRELREKTALAEDAQRRAEQANLAKSRFFAAASHDLRQPLQALGLFAASLREGRRDPAEARRIDRILSSVDVLESLFDELLDISKLDAGYVNPAPQHFTAATLFERLEHSYAPFAMKSGLALSFDHGSAVLHSDPVLLGRVLGNLVSNALRYTPAGSVAVRCLDRGSNVSIEVADTGPGIPPEEHERVFDEFYQLGNPERDRRKGLGLGLATVRRIAHLLGTRVTLVSEPGRGATFVVEVPRGDAQMVAPAAAVPAPDDVDVLRGKTIVIVDNERDVREGLSELLNLWHCHVVAADSAGEAIEKLRTSAPPDVLVADYRLKDGASGIDAIAALRARFGAELPALLMSGDTNPDIFRLVQEQRLPLLSKPVRAARLRAALAHLVNRSRQAATRST